MSSGPEPERRGIWRLIAPLSFGLAALPVLIELAMRRRPDIVLCIEPTLFAAPAAIAAARLCGARLTLHVQDLEVDAAFATNHLRGCWLRSVADCVERAVLHRFDRVITISDAMARRLAAKGVVADRLGVLRNWIEPAPPPTEEQCRAVRDRLGIEADERIVLYSGHLGAKQGIPALLAALHRLIETLPDVRIVIAGEGPMAPLVAAARTTIAGLVFMPLLPKAALPALLAMADVLLLPQSPCAADLVFPSKLGPMLASGRPVVATADAGSELATWLHGAAIVVPAGDAAAFAAGIERALEGDPVCRQRKARSLALTLDADIVLPAFEACLFAMAAAPGAAAGGRLITGDAEAAPATP